MTPARHSVTGAHPRAGQGIASGVRARRAGHGRDDASGNDHHDQRGPNARAKHRRHRRERRNRRGARGASRVARRSRAARRPSRGGAARGRRPRWPEHAPGRVPSAAFRSAYNGAKHFLNAITANLRDEMREKHPGIQVSLVSPGIVSTAFGTNAVHGGPDSRTLPMSQPVEDVAAVIVRVIDTQAPDVYTRAGMHDRVVDYFRKLSADP